MKRLKRFAALALTLVLAVPTDITSVRATENTQVSAQVEETQQMQSQDSSVPEIADGSSVDNSSDKNVVNMSEQEYQAWKQSYLQKQKDNHISQDSDDAVETTAYSDGNYVRNEIIEAFVGNDGRFTIGTVAGSDRTTDDNKILLFGHPSPWSSFTTVKLDGVNYVFEANQNWVQTEDAIMVSQRNGQVVTTQSIYLEENEYTGLKDTVAITYTVTNYDTVAHEAGVRIMMDTMLSNNDGAPFRVPGYGNVVKELELTGGDIPQNWMAFDNLLNPNVIANGCFYKNLSEKPDKVQFAHWGGVYSTSWDYTVNPETHVTGDSAVVMYYNPVLLEAGESRTVTTYYGIGEFATSDTRPPLSLRVVAPSTLMANEQEGGYIQNPFSVTSYVQNTGDGTATNVKASIELPKDGSLQLVSPAQNVISVGDIEPGEEEAVTWVVYAQSQTKDKKVSYSVSVDADNEDEKTVSMSTLLKETNEVDNNFTISLDKKTLSLDVDGKFYDKIKATCSDNVKRTITWMSTNPDVVSVDKDGNVKAISGGSANIIASAGGVSALCQVSVKGTATPLEKLQMNVTELSMKIGDVKFLKEVYTPSSVSQKGVKWSSSNPAVAKVNDNGKVEAIANGNAVITATANSDSTKKATCSVQVGSDKQNLELVQDMKFSDTIYGPSVSVLGKTFNLFKFPATINIGINEAFSLQYSEADKTLTGTFGLTGDGSLFDGDEYKNDVAKVKKAADMLKKWGPKKFIKSYGKSIKRNHKSNFFTEGGDFHTFGYVKLQQVEGDYKLSEGSLYVVVNLGEAGWKFVVPAAPVVYFKFSLSGSVQAGLDLKLDEYGVENIGSLKVNGSIGAEAALTGAVGADVMIAGLEGGLTGKLSINIAKLFGFVPQQDLSVKISAEAYIKAHALFFLSFTESWEFASKTLYPSSSNDANSLSVASIDTDDFEPMSISLDDASLEAMSVDTQSISYQELENKGYAYNEPDMVELEDGRVIAVWADNVDDRLEFNRTGIYYSVYDGSTWSDAELVDDDGTADFSPAIAADGNSAYVVWQNSEVAYNEGDEVGLDTMLPNMGIKAAYFDGNSFTDTVVLSSENDGYDNIPFVTVNEGTATAVWNNNASNDWSCLTGVNTVRQVSFEMSEVTQQPEDDSEESSEGNSEESSEGNSEESSEGNSEEGSEGNSEESSEGNSEENSANTSGEVLENNSEESSEGVSKEISEQEAVLTIDDEATATSGMFNTVNTKETETEEKSEAETEAETEAESETEEKLEAESEAEEKSEAESEAEEKSEAESEAEENEAEPETEAEVEAEENEAEPETEAEAEVEAEEKSEADDSELLTAQETEEELVIVSSQNIFSAEKVVKAYNIGTNNGDTVVVINVDDDKDLSTTEDVKNIIYVNGVENTSYEGKITGALPVMVQSGDKTDLFWWDGSEIKCMKSLDASQIASCIAMGQALPFNVAENNGNYSIYWSETDGDNASIVAAYYNKAKNKWSAPVELVSGTDGVFRSPKAILQGQDELFIITNAVVLDEDNQDIAVMLCSIEATPKMDIQVDSELYFADTTVGYGKTVTLYADIKNIGVKEAEKFNLVLKDDQGNMLATKTENISLLAGESATVSIDYLLPDVLAKHRVYLTVSPLNGQDVNTDDNVASAVLGDSVISIEDIKINGQGRLRTASIEIVNRGYEAEENISLVLRENSAEGKLIGEVTISSIDARAKRNISIDIDMRTIDFAGSNSKPLYVEVRNENGPCGIGSQQSILLINPEVEERFTLNTGVYDNKSLLLTIYNNRGEESAANLIIELLNGDEIVFNLGQSISLDAYASDTTQYDLASVLIYPHDRICAYVKSDDGTVLSNIIYHNSQVYSAGKFNLDVEQKYLVLKTGETKQIDLDIADNDFVLADLTWKSSDETVATVNQIGEVTAIKEGTTIISITSDFAGYTAECRVTVTDETPVNDYDGTVLKTENVTIDLAKASGEVISFAPLFDEIVQAASVEEDGFVSSVIESVKFGDTALDELFTIELIDDGHILVVPTQKAANSGEYTGRTYITPIMLKLKGSSQSENIGELTIKTVKTNVTAQVNVDELGNFFVTDKAEVKAESKLAKVTGVEIDTTVDAKNTNPQYFALTDNDIKISEAGKDIKAGKYKIRFKVSLEGYLVPAMVETTVKVVDNTPKLKLSSNTVNLRSNPNGYWAYLSLVSNDKNTNADNYEITEVKFAEQLSDYQIQLYEGDIAIRNINAISGSDKVDVHVTLNNAIRPLVFGLNIKAVTGNKFTVSAKNVKINSAINSGSYSQYVHVSNGADNDPVNEVTFREVVNGKEKYLTNIIAYYNSVNRTVGIGAYSYVKKGTYTLRIYNGSDYADVKVKVEKKYPAFKSSKGSLTLNTATCESQRITISNNMNVNTGYSISFKNSKNKYVYNIASCAVSGNAITVTPISSAKPGSYKMIITPYSYYGAKPVTVKIKVVNKAPTFKLSTKKINLNSALTYKDEAVNVTLKSNPANYAKAVNVRFVQLDSRGNAINLKDFVVSKNDENITIQRASDNVADGKYKLRAIVESFNVKVDFDVTVKKKVPQFTQKGKITLNSSLPAGLEMIPVNMKSSVPLSDFGEFTFQQKSGSSVSECKDVQIIRDGTDYYVALSNTSSVKKGTIELVAKSQKYPSKDTKIKITVTDKAPSIKVTAKGKIDTVNKNSSVQCKLVFQNANISQSADAKLTVNNPNFKIYSYNPADGTFSVMMSPDADLTAKNANKAVFSYHSPDGTVINSKEMKIGVTSSKVKVALDSKNYELHKQDSRDEAIVTMTLSGNANAVVDDVKLSDNKFTIRCVSKANHKYAIGFADSKAVSESTYDVKLEIYVHGLKKPVKQNIKIVVK